MADNVTYPGDPAATKTVWTDEVAGSKHAQYVKLVDGTADSVAIIPGDATNGLYVNVKSLTGGNPVPIEYADSWIVDAFGRQRVSLPNKLLELKHIHDARTLQTSSVQISGSGTSAATQIAAIASDLWPGIGADGSQDVVALAVQRLTGTTETFWGAMTLLETI